MRIYLSKKVTSEKFSIEANKADNLFHFDHHGEFKDYPSPCNNHILDNILPEVEDECLITHLDADTFVGLLRLSDLPLPPVDLNLMEYIDNNGSKNIEKTNKVLAYMVGIISYAREFGFPFCPAKGRVEVTNVIRDLAEIHPNSIILRGYADIEKSEAGYREAEVKVVNGIGLYNKGVDTAFNPSRPYEDDVQIVVVYNQKFKSISLYADPDTDHVVKGKWKNIVFAGHDKACGSPRGTKFTFPDAEAVFEDIVDELG